MEILRLGDIEKLSIIDFKCECREKENHYYDLFHGGRICKFCAINMDIKDQDILQFFHGTCWQDYRRNGLVYPLPANV